MAFRLSEQVIRGELINTQRFSTHGWLELRGADRPLLLHLTGNCSPDLAGWHIRFQAKNAAVEDGFITDPSSLDKNEVERLPTAENLLTSSEVDLKDSESGSEQDHSNDDCLNNIGPGSSDICGLRWEQIGPTGTMTADRQVRVFDCSFEEFYRRAKLDEPPPTQWKRCLYLEWFSQNGRVVLELPDPVLEFVERIDWSQGQDRVEEVASDLGDADFPASSPPASGLGITEIHINEVGQPEIAEQFFSAGNDDDELDVVDFSEDCEENEDDPFHLFPNDLQKQLDTQAYHTDWLLKSESEYGEKPESIREMELMDFLIENSDGEAFDSFCHIPVTLEKMDFLNDEQVEQALKDILGQMALYGVALDVCKHYSGRMAYRLLLEEIIPQEHFYPELRGTSWVQHYCTHEFCPDCDAEMDIKFQELEQRRKEHPEEFSGPSSGDWSVDYDDDEPF
jgi:hypothetical protein